MVRHSQEPKKARTETDSTGEKGSELRRETEKGKEGKTERNSGRGRWSCLREILIFKAD